MDEINPISFLVVLFSLKSTKPIKADNITIETFVIARTDESGNPVLLYDTKRR